MEAYFRYPRWDAQTAKPAICSGARIEFGNHGAVRNHDDAAILLLVRLERQTAQMEETNLKIKSSVKIIK